MALLLYSFVEADQADAVLAASCRTDFGGAIITGADFTNALVDKSQQIVSVQNNRVAVGCISLAVCNTRSHGR